MTLEDFESEVTTFCQQREINSRGWRPRPQAVPGGYHVYARPTVLFQEGVTICREYRTGRWEVYSPMQGFGATLKEAFYNSLRESMIWGQKGIDKARESIAQAEERYDALRQHFVLE